MPIIKKILVATDFSESTDHVLDQVQDLAQAMGAELLLLHVLDTTPYILTGDVGYSSAALVASHEKAVKTSLAQLESKLSAGGLKVTARLEYGTPHERIVEIARSQEAQLIAMGTHGRSGLRHMLMGSVAERVARTSPVPVLTLRSAA